MYRCILVATDGSDLCAKAVDSAIAMAVLAGAQLVALRVVAHYQQVFFEGALPPNVEDVDQIEKEWVEGGQITVNIVKSAAEAKGVKTTAVVVKSGVVSEAIIQTAALHQCDLIVMASHRRSGLKRLLLGSETLNVLTHSTTPVLVLR